MTIPHRTVRIVRDTASPLWVIRCARPCAPEGWCQITPSGERLCWLGSGSTPEIAAGLARRVGYTVQDGLGSHTDARPGQAAAAGAAE